MSERPRDDLPLRAAARALLGARHLVITAGAGMGVDSGLPDFRGDRGFWAAYPPYERLGLRFVELANPASFERDPALGWGFYGHRANLYRRTVPHEGFHILRRWAAAKQSWFVATSNVDGQFQAAGFAPDRVYELHGSIGWLQCSAPCGEDPWPLPPGEVPVEEPSLRAVAPLPACPACGRLARPNILMFGDARFVPGRVEAQAERFGAFLEGADGPIVVVELGAGTAVPSVRALRERLVSRLGATLVRVNPRESHGPSGTLGLAAGALAGLRALDEALAVA